MTACELLDLISACGGIVLLDDARIHYDPSGEAAAFLPELIARREEVRRLLQDQQMTQPIPTGFRLLTWKLKAGPVIVENVSVIGDSASFAREKLKQLAAATANPILKSIVPHLLDQLVQVGVILADKQDCQE